LTTVSSSTGPHHNLRYDFDADLKTLIIRMPKASHEESAMGFFRTLDGSMKHQEEACGQALPWSLGTGLESRIGRSKSRFVADVTIHNDFNKPLLITEVRHHTSTKPTLSRRSPNGWAASQLLWDLSLSMSMNRRHIPPTPPLPCAQRPYQRVSMERDCEGSTCVRSYPLPRTLLDGVCNMFP